MAVPVPLEITVAPPPKGVSLKFASDIVNLIAASLSGTMDVELLQGKVGGSQPGSNIGPWLNGTEWYFWTGSGYTATQQGCPVGTVAIWGGADKIPAGWLLCEGQSVSVSSYRELFNAIQYTWGGSGGSFNLPPGAVFFLNAPGFAFDPQVPNVSDGPNGINSKGGAQTTLITADSLPQLQIQLLYLNPGMLTQNINLADAIAAYPTGYYYPVTDAKGNILGTNQQSIAVMPPFAAANFIIKYM